MEKHEHASACTAGELRSLRNPCSCYGDGNVAKVLLFGGVSFCNYDTLLFSDAIAFFNGTTCSFLDSRFLYGILVYFLGNRSAFRNSWYSFFPPFPINFLIIKYSSVLSVFYYIIAMWTRITCFLFHLVSFLKLWFSLWLVDEILLYFAFIFLLWY